VQFSTRFLFMYTARLLSRAMEAAEFVVPGKLDELELPQGSSRVDVAGLGVDGADALVDSTSPSCCLCHTPAPDPRLPCPQVSPARCATTKGRA